jgi:hypothetical protein
MHSGRLSASISRVFAGAHAATAACSHTTVQLCAQVPAAFPMGCPQVSAPAVAVSLSASFCLLPEFLNHPWFFFWRKPCADKDHSDNLESCRSRCRRSKKTPEPGGIPEWSRNHIFLNILRGQWTGRQATTSFHILLFPRAHHVLAIFRREWRIICERIGPGCFFIILARSWGSVPDQRKNF